MKITVSTKNEFPFHPDIADNLKMDSKDQFTVVLRKLNDTLHSRKWATFKRDGEFDIDLQKKIKAHIVELINPPILAPKDGSKEIELTIDILIDSDYPELFNLTHQIIDEINRLQDVGSIDTKK